MTETSENRIKRLRMRSMRRGIKEMDIILMRFSNAGLENLNDIELSIYDDLLSENDHDIYQWVSGQKAAPERYVALVCLISENGKFSGIV